MNVLGIYLLNIIIYKYITETLVFDMYRGYRYKSIFIDRIVLTKTFHYYLVSYEYC